MVAAAAAAVAGAVAATVAVPAPAAVATVRRPGGVRRVEAGMATVVLAGKAARAATHLLATPAPTGNPTRCVAGATWRRAPARRVSPIRCAPAWT